MTYDPVTLAYLAGLIDGEGCISISLRINTPSRTPQMRLMIGMTDAGVTQWLHETFGGSLHRQIHRGPRCRPVYRWMVGHKQAAALLAEVLPYLKVKHRQAYIFIRFHEVIREDWTIRKRSKGRQSKLRARDVELRKNVYDMMKRLNTRGLPEEEDIIAAVGEVGAA